MVQFLVTFCGHCAPLFLVAAVVSNRLLAGNGFIGTINVVCRRPGGRGSSCRPHPAQLGPFSWIATRI